MPLNGLSLETHNTFVENQQRKHKLLETEVENHFLALYLAKQPEKTYSGEVLAIGRDGKPLVQITDLGIERSCESEVPVNIGARYGWKPQLDTLAGTVTWIMAASGKERSREDCDDDL